MARLRQTPSQTIGPFFAYSLTAEQYGYHYNSIVDGSMTGGNADGEKIYIVGNVFDGKDMPISDAMLELWQADAHGRYRKLIEPEENGFTGFGRLGTGTDPGFQFRFTTIKPGSIGKNQAPHINIILFMRGSLHSYYTRLYFSDEREMNEKDEILNIIPLERRHTLIAEQRENKGIAEYHFDIYMQGKNETIFFEL